MDLAFPGVMLPESYILHPPMPPPKEPTPPPAAPSPDNLEIVELEAPKGKDKKRKRKAVNECNLNLKFEVKLSINPGFSSLFSNKGKQFVLNVDNLCQGLAMPIAPVPCARCIATNQQCEGAYPGCSHKCDSCTSGQQVCLLMQQNELEKVTANWMQFASTCSKSAIAMATACLSAQYYQDLVSILHWQQNELQLACSNPAQIYQYMKKNDPAFNNSDEYIAGLPELFGWKLIQKASKIVEVEQPAPKNFPEVMLIHSMSDKEAAMPIRAQVFNKWALVDPKGKESTAAPLPSVPVEVDQDPQEVEEEEDTEGKVDDFLTKGLQPSATSSSVRQKRGPVSAEFVHTSVNEDKEEDADQCPAKKSKFGNGSSSLKKVPKGSVMEKLGDHHLVNNIPPPVTEEDGKLTDIVAELAATSASLQEQAMLLHNLQENYAKDICQHVLQLLKNHTLNFTGSKEQICTLSLAIGWDNLEESAINEFPLEPLVVLRYNVPMLINK
ncbi:hypothetical protein GYMLUDRAFT_251108 [Collybiopsis luxurians FD-317 M1]|uniref:Uncharacterized protein n=1 Tax=Collybiopsis luxurians FD-317 M1 TaxID=944289 RepID=A0A0D0C473_9AGAR|nr:hypothetical protein GYMLUDRAFT_251108 [Collybiopsis luxurians FD-317 M1]